MNDAGNRHPIFIHALFRSGSTYFSQAFRRLGGEYTCFHEPLHELALQARQDPELLNNDQDAGKAGELRHPTLNRPYFAELYAMAGEVLPRLHESDIYHGYFGTPTDCRGLDYWRALIDHAPGRPVIQECRAAGRIGAIRHNLGGCHAYLWRNPWDQWWSYQVSPYFDLTTQLILNATPSHPLVERLIEHIGFTPVHGSPLHVAYDWFEHRPLAPDHSYQAFYALWLLALQQAREHADRLINIDELSADVEARRSTEQWFVEQGVAGLDLSDCHSPVTVFSTDEQTRLEELEGEVHRLWGGAGLSEEALDRLLALRAEKAPRRSGPDNETALRRELARYRELVTGRQQVMNERLHSMDAQMQAGHRREDDLRERLEQLQRENEAQGRPWRLTALTRNARTFTRLLRSRGLRVALASAIDAIERRSHSHPLLRRRLLALVSRIPGVSRRLRRLQHRHQNPDQQPQPPSEVSQPLTPRAREIHQQLRAEMDRLDSTATERDHAHRR